jgi:hypothetical protein
MRGRINELLQIVSLPIPNTIGIVDVARLAARGEGSPPGDHVLDGAVVMIENVVRKRSQFPDGAVAKVARASQRSRSTMRSMS